ncbi:MAG: hypothetical protein OXK81_05045 [Chloroflexota bacterium]|nr:hypothetical protein [Chloroflexota bacterium]
MSRTSILGGCIGFMGKTPVSSATVTPLAYGDYVAIVYATQINPLFQLKKVRL